MRALLTLILLLAVPASALGKPLDADRTFARNGVLRLGDPWASSAVLALAGGGTLHVTTGGMMRLTPRGGYRGLAPVVGGTVTEMAPGLAIGTGPVAYGEPTPLATWRIGRDGTLAPPTVIPLPGSANPLRVIRRRGGYAALVWTPGRHGLLLVALTPDGALDTGWNDGGIREVAGDYGDLALAAAPDGSLIHASIVQTVCDRRGYTERKERARVRLQRFAPDGSAGPVRRTAVGARTQCPMTETGEARVDGRGRVAVAGQFGTHVAVVRFTRGLRRDRRFRASVRLPEGSWLNSRLERRPGGGYALGFTDGRGSVPHGTVALFDRRGRRIALRRLKVTRNYPTSDLQDIVFDRRGGLIAAGSLRDTDTYIREDYGAPHLAVWRLRTTR